MSPPSRRSLATVAVALLARSLARLPLPLLHALGGLLGHATYALSPRYRRKLQRMLATAGLDTPAMRRHAAAEAGRFALETPWVWLRPVADVLARVEPVDWSALDEPTAAGRGVLVLTPHLGSFEVAARCRAQVAPLTVLYKPPRRQALRALVESGRAVPGLTGAPATLSGVRTLLRALRRGEAVGLLPDQVPDAGEGTWAPFFDRAAYTMTLPERLAEASGAAVTLLVAERLPRGRGWRIHVERFDGRPDAAALNAAMERLVRRFPEQYLWAYNRYRRPSGAPPPDATGAGPGAAT